MAILTDIFGARANAVADAYSELLDIANRKTRPDHSEFLQFAVRVLLRLDSRRRSLVCLWLRDWDKGRYLLDLFECDDRTVSRELRAELESQLRSRSVEEPSTAMSDGAAGEALRNAMGACTQVRAAAVRLGASPHVGQFLMKDRGSAGSTEDAETPHECRIIGVLQVWSSSALTEGENLVLRHVAQSLATNLHRHRSRRELVALKRLQDTAQADGTKVVSWYRTAASALGEATSADYCLILEPTPERSLQGVVAWGRNSGFEEHPERFVAGNQSVLRRLFENSTGTIRIADWNDEDERLRELGTRDYDTHLAGTIHGWVGPRTPGWRAP